MQTSESDFLHYWNFYISIEKDLENLSRYIEFSENNLSTYSIEITRLFLQTSSEIDIILKEICALIDNNKKYSNINDYKFLVNKNLTSLTEETVTIPRYGISFEPWYQWRSNETPKWWKNYNNVKHERNKFYKSANLKNLIYSVGALLICNIYYYKLFMSKELKKELNFKEITRILSAEKNLLKFDYP